MASKMTKYIEPIVYQRLPNAPVNQVVHASSLCDKQPIWEGIKCDVMQAPLLCHLQCLSKDGRHQTLLLVVLGVRGKE